VNIKTKWIITALAFMVTACGKVGPLEPRAGHTPPAKAYGAETIPDSERLMKPAVQTRPARSDELMRRSERRSDDPFDLPPVTDAPVEETAKTITPAEPPSPPNN
jgi:predicted small lipoprotein YifL